MALEQRVDRSQRGDDVDDEIDLDLRIRLPPEEYTDDELLQNTLTEASDFLRELAAEVES